MYTHHCDDWLTTGSSDGGPLTMDGCAFEWEAPHIQDHHLLWLDHGYSLFVQTIPVPQEWLIIMNLVLGESNDHDWWHPSQLWWTDLERLTVKINPPLKFHTYWPFGAIHLIPHLSIQTQVVPHLDKTVTSSNSPLYSHSYLAHSHCSTQVLHTEVAEDLEVDLVGQGHVWTAALNGDAPLSLSL